MAPLGALQRLKPMPGCPTSVQLTLLSPMRLECSIQLDYAGQWEDFYYRLLSNTDALRGCASSKSWLSNCHVFIEHPFVLRTYSYSSYEEGCVFSFRREHTQNSLLNTMVLVYLVIHGILFLGCGNFLQGFSSCLFFFFFGSRSQNSLAQGHVNSGFYLVTHKLWDLQQVAHLSEPLSFSQLDGGSRIWITITFSYGIWFPRIQCTFSFSG